jgi:uncharacterized protein YbjT (DUF2867 family)
MKLVSVIGATGRQGLAQIRQLLSAGYQVRALSRHEKPDLGPIKANIETRRMDIFDPSTFAAAFEGSDAVFYTNPVQARAEQGRLPGELGFAAKQAGVKRFVWNTSSWIPDKPGDPGDYGLNSVGVNALLRSGVPATVFGAVLFMDNLLTNWARPFIVNERRYVYAHQPHLLANWISLDDVAKVMIAALERPDFEGAWMNIGGPQRLSPPEVAATLSQAFGHEIKYDPCTPEEFGDYLVRAMGDDMPQEMRAAYAKGIADFYNYNNTTPTKPFEVNMDYVMERLPEVAFETMLDWAKRQDWSDDAHRPAGG